MPVENDPVPTSTEPSPAYESTPVGETQSIIFNTAIYPQINYANSTTPLWSEGGSAGSVNSVSAGAGLVVSPTTGNVVVSMPAVGTAGTIQNPASITTDAQGRITNVASLGYVPVSPATLGAYAPLAGATFTGAVSGIAPVSDQNLATKLYVDNAVAGGGSGVYLPLAGGTMTGAINLNGNQLNNVSLINNANGDLDIQGKDVNIRQLDAGTEELPNVLNITSAGATVIASGGAVSCTAVGAVNMTAGLSASLYATAGSVSIGGPVNHITVEADGTTVSGVSDLIASGEISAQSLDITAGAVVGGGLQAESLGATNGIIATGNVNLSGATSVSVPTPTLPGQAATKQYVDDKSGLPLISNVQNLNFPAPTIYNIPDTDCVDGTIFLVSVAATAGGYEIALPATSTNIAVGTTIIIQSLATNTQPIIISEQLGAQPFRNNNVYPGGSLMCVLADINETSTPPNALLWTNGKTFSSISLAGTEEAQPVVGPVVFDNAANLQCQDIRTGLISALPAIDFISITDPMQTRELGVRSADGVEPATIRMALTESALPADVLSMLYDPDGDDALVVNKKIIADGVNLNDAIAFKDTNEFFVSANGSDTTGNGSANAPYATIQKAITVAEAALSSNIVINVAAGVYNENITISKGHIVINGNVPSDRAVEGVALNGKILINITDVDNLFNNQVILSGFFLSGQIEDVSTKQHTLIVNGMRIEADSAISGQAIYVHPTSTTQRTIVQQCVISQEADMTDTSALVDIRVGWLDMTTCSASIRTTGSVINIAGNALISRLYESTIESDSTSGSASALLTISSTTSSAHNIAQNTFAMASSTPKTDTPAIRSTSATLQTVVLGQNFFAIAGTTTATNVVKFSGAVSLIVAVANNRAATNTASTIQSGATVVPLTTVGETFVNSIVAGSGISATTTNGVATIANTGVLELTAGTNITISGSKNNYTINATGGSSGVQSVSAGTGIGVSGTATDPIINNTGVLAVSAGTGISLGGSAAEPVINATGIQAVSVGTGLATTGGTSPTLSIADTSVVAATYTYPSITVNAQGQITAASSLAAVSEVGAGDGISVEAQGTGVVITNSGVRTLTADTGIIVGGTANAPTVANDGVLTVNSFKGAVSLVAGTGIGLEADTGVITITNSSPNAGVQSLVAGTGIVIDPSVPETPVISNDGVLSVNGANAQITVAGGTNITVATVGNTITVSAPNAAGVNDTINSSACTFEGFVSNVSAGDPISSESPTLIFTYTELLELPFWRYTNKVIGYLGYLTMALNASHTLQWTATVSKNGSAHVPVIGTLYYTDSKYFSVPVNMISQIGVLPDTFYEYSTGDTVQIKFYAQQVGGSSSPTVLIAPQALQAIYSPINGGNAALPASGTIPVSSPVSTVSPLDPANNYRFSNGLGVEATLTTYVDNVPETPVNVAVGATYPPVEDPEITGRDGYTMVEATPVFPSSPITITAVVPSPAGIDPLITYTFINGSASESYIVSIYLPGQPGTPLTEIAPGQQVVAPGNGYTGYTVALGGTPPPPVYPTSPITITEPTGITPEGLNPDVQYTFINNAGGPVYRITGYIGGSIGEELEIPNGGSGQLSFAGFTGYTAIPI
jgi:hypothetical protein